MRRPEGASIERSPEGPPTGRPAWPSSPARARARGGVASGGRSPSCSTARKLPDDCHGHVMWVSQRDGPGGHTDWRIPHEQEQHHPQARGDNRARRREVLPLGLRHRCDRRGDRRLPGGQPRGRARLVLRARRARDLVVVDQVRNIGALAISRARLAGLDVAYLPGLARTTRRSCSPATPRPTRATPR